MRNSFLKIILPAILFFLASFFIPSFAVRFDLPTLLTIVSLIFAILVGFFIATATSNYLRLQAVIVEEDSSIISIFHLAKIIQPRIVPKLRRAIDNYLVATLDYSLEDYVEQTWKEFDHLIHLIQEIKPSTKLGADLYDDLFVKRDTIIRTRQETTCIAPRIVSSQHWMILIALSGLLVFLLFALRDGGLTIALISGLLSFAIYLVLRLLYEIDTNLFLENQLGYQSPQRVFQNIGTKNYYPEHGLKTHRLKTPNEPYRVGVWTTMNHRVKKSIKIVDPR